MKKVFAILALFGLGGNGGGVPSLHGLRHVHLLSRTGHIVSGHVHAERTVGQVGHAFPASVGIESLCVALTLQQETGGDGSLGVRLVPSLVIDQRGYDVRAGLQVRDQVHGLVVPVNVYNSLY